MTTKQKAQNYLKERLKDLENFHPNTFGEGIDLNEYEKTKREDAFYILGAIDALQLIILTE